MTFLFSYFRVLFFAPLILFLAGCSGGLLGLPSAGSAPTVYRLQVETVSAQPEKGIILLLEDPTLSESLRGQDIAVTGEDGSLSYYGDVNWSDRTSQLIRRFLRESFEAQGYTVLSPASADLPSDYRLKMDVRDFTFHSESMRVVVDVQAMLLRSNPYSLIESKRFASEARVSSDEPGTTVDGFQMAMEGLAEDMGIWLAANTKR